MHQPAHCKSSLVVWGKTVKGIGFSVMDCKENLYISSEFYVIGFHKNNQTLG